VEGKKLVDIELGFKIALEKFSIIYQHPVMARKNEGKHKCFLCKKWFSLFFKMRGYNCPAKVFFYHDGSNGAFFILIRLFLAGCFYKFL